jgi:hypothetical protein
MKLLHWGSAIVLIWSAGTAVQASDKDFDVQFQDCVEYVGIGLVPAARARPLVPAEYTLAGDANNAVIVVRVANCASVAVAGKNARAARTAQVGIMLNGPDPSADINNYLLWYVTDHGQLHGALSAAGLKAGNDQQLSFVFAPTDATGPLSIDVDAASFPPYQLAGQATAPSASPVSFVANWWFDGTQGVVRMHSVFPEIRFSSASMTLTTPANSSLSALIGGTSLQFALLDSYNSFEDALMEVRLP